MSTKLWILSELYYPDEISTGYLLTKIAEGLAQDRVVGVICGSPRYFNPSKVERRFEIRNRVEIRRCPSMRLDKNNLIYRLFNAISTSLLIFFTALRQVRAGDVMLVVTNPPILPFLALVISRVRRAKYILLVHDVYPEVLAVTGIITQESLLFRLGSWLGDWLYSSVDRIVVLGRDMQALVRDRLSKDQGYKISVIPNWADTDDVVPLTKFTNPLLLKLGLTERFVVGYAGNMGRPNDIESLVACARLLREKDQIRFLFLGTGAKRAWLENTVRAEGLSNITILPPSPRKDQRIFLNACDVAVVPLVEGMTGVGVPSRMYNIMAAGRPIIAVAESQSELALVVDEERIGWVVPPGSPSDLAGIVLEAAMSPTRLAEMGGKARSAAQSRFSFERSIDEYRRLLEEVAYSYDS